MLREEMAVKAMSLHEDGGKGALVSGDRGESGNHSNAKMEGVFEEEKQQQWWLQQ